MKEHTEWKKTINYISDKKIVSGIYKELKNKKKI